MVDRIAGIAFLKVNGRQYPLRGNFTVSPSPSERTMIAGQDGIHGWKEEPRVPFIEGDVSLVAELAVEDVQRVTNATIQADLPNGSLFVLRDAVCKSALELNTGDGLMRVRFEGVQADEIR